MGTLIALLLLLLSSARVFLISHEFKLTLITTNISDLLSAVHHISQFLYFVFKIFTYQISQHWNVKPQAYPETTSHKNIINFFVAFRTLTLANRFVDAFLFLLRFWFFVLFIDFRINSLFTRFVNEPSLPEVENQLKTNINSKILNSRHLATILSHSWSTAQPSWRSNGKMQITREYGRFSNNRLAFEWRISVYESKQISDLFGVVVIFFAKLSLKVHSQGGRPKLFYSSLRYFFGWKEMAQWAERKLTKQSMKYFYTS